MDEIVAKATVEISPDLTAFKQRLKAQLDEAMAGVSGNVTSKLGVNSSEAEAELERSRAQLAEFGQSSATATAHIQTTGDPNAIGEFDSQLQQTTQHLRSFETEAERSGRDIDDLGTKAESTKAKAEELGQASETAGTHVKHLGEDLKTTGERADNSSKSLRHASDSASALGSGSSDAGEAITGLLMPAVLALAPALVPIAGVATGASIALAGIGTAAGIGLGAFALASVPVFKQVSTAMQQITTDTQAVQNATTAAAKNSAILRLQNEIKSLNPEIATLVEGVDKAKSAFKAWDAQFQPEILSVFNQALTLVQPALDAFTPAVHGGATAISELLTNLKGVFEAPDFHQFIAWAGQEAPRALLTLANVFENFAGGFSKMMEAFTPFMHQIEDGLTGMTAHFETFAESDTFKSFVAYVIKEGPAVGQFFEQLFQFVGRLLVTLAPVGAVALLVTTKVLELFNAFQRLHPGLATAAIGLTLITVLAAKSVNAFTALAGEVGKPIKEVVGLTRAFLGLGAAEEYSSGQKIAAFLGSTLVDAAKAAGSAVQAMGRAISSGFEWTKTLILQLLGVKTAVAETAVATEGLGVEMPLFGGEVGVAGVQLDLFAAAADQTTAQLALSSTAAEGAAVQMALFGTASSEAMGQLVLFDDTTAIMTATTDTAAASQGGLAAAMALPGKSFGWIKNFIAGMFGVQAATDEGYIALGAFAASTDAATIGADALAASTGVAAVSTDALVASTGVAAVGVGGLAVAMDVEAVSADVAGASTGFLAGAFAALDVAALPVIAIIGLIVVAVAAVGIAIYELVEHWRGAWHGILVVIDEARRLIGDAVDWIKTHLALAATAFAVLGIAATAAFPEIVIPIVAIGAVIAGLVIGIKALVSHWSQVWGEIKRITMEVFDWLRHNPLAEILLAPIASLLILAANWKTVWRDIQTVTRDVVRDVGGFFRAIPDALNSVNTALDHFYGHVAPILQAVVNGFRTGFDSVHNILDTVGRFIAHVFDDVAGAASKALHPLEEAWNSFAKWFDSYKGELSQVLHGIEDVFKVVFEALVIITVVPFNIIKDVVSTAMSVVSGNIRSGFNEIRNVAAPVLNAMRLLFDLNMKAIETVVRTVWPLISGAFRIGLDIMKTTTTVALTIISSVFRTVFGAISVVVRVAIDVVVGILKVAFDIIKGIFEVSLDLITGHWSRAWHDLIATLSGVGSALVGIVKSVFSDLLGYIIGTAVSIAEAGWKIGKTLIDGFVTGLNIAWHSVVDFVTGIPGKIESFLKSADTWLVQIGKDIIKGLVNGIKSVVDLPGKALEDVGKAMLGPFKTVLGLFSPSAVMHGHGVGLMQGLSNGIKEGASNPAAALQQAATDLLGGFKTFFGIASPSTVMATSGGDMMAGLAQGISQNKKLAQAEMASLKLADQLTPDLKKLHDATTGIGKDLTALATGLFDLGVVAQGLQGHTKPITDTLGAVARALEGLKGETIPKGLTTSLQALSDLAKNLHPELLFQAFLDIGQGIQYVAPHIKDLDNLSGALDKLFKVKIPSGFTTNLQALASVGKDLNPTELFAAFDVIGNGLKFIEPNIGVLTDLAKGLKGLNGVKVPSGLTTDLQALADVGKNLHPGELFAIFLTIGQGIQYVAPHIPQLDQLAISLEKLKNVKIPSGLTTDLQALGNIGKTFNPSILFDAFFYIGQGITYVAPHIPDLNSLSKALGNLAKIRLPKGLVDDLNALANVSTNLHPELIYQAFLNIGQGIAYVKSDLDVLNKLGAALDHLGTVKLPKSLLDGLSDLAAIGKTFNPSILFDAFLYIGQGIRYVEPFIGSLQNLGKAIKDLSGVKLPKGLVDDLHALADVGKSLDPVKLFASFNNIAQGIGAIAPHVRTLDDLTTSLDKLAKVTLPKPLTDGLKLLADIGKNLVPEVIFAAFLYIGKGIQYVEPFIGSLQALGKAIKDLSGVKLPKGLIDDLNALSKLGTSLDPVKLYQSFNNIAQGIGLVAPHIHDLDSLVGALNNLGKVTISKSVTADLQAIADAGKKLTNVALFASFDIIAQGLKLVAGQLPTLDALGKGLNDIGQVKVPKGLEDVLKALDHLATDLKPAPITAALGAIQSGIVALGKDTGTASTISDNAKALGAFDASLKTLLSDMKPVPDAATHMTDLATGIGKVATAISGVKTGGFSTLTATVEAFRDKWSGDWQAISGTVSTAWSSMQSTFRQIKPSALGDLATAVDSLKKTWGADWGGIKLDLTGVDSAIKSTTQKAQGDLTALLTAVRVLEAGWRVTWMQIAADVASSEAKVSGTLLALEGQVRRLGAGSAFADALKPVDGSLRALGTSVGLTARGFAEGALDALKLAAAFHTTDTDAGRVVGTMKGIEESVRAVGAAVIVAVRSLGTDLLDALTADERVAKSIAPAIHQVALEVELVGRSTRASVADWDAFGKALDGVLVSIAKLVSESQRISTALTSAGGGAKTLSDEFARTVNEIRIEGFGKLETAVDAFRSKWAADWEAVRVALATSWVGMEGTFRQMKTSALSDLTGAVQTLRSTWASDWDAIKLTITVDDAVIRTVLRTTVVDLGNVEAAVLALESTWKAAWSRIAIAPALHQVGLEVETVARATRASLTDWDAFGRGLEGVLGSITRLTAEARLISTSLTTASSGAKTLGAEFLATVNVIRSGFGTLETAMTEFRSRWIGDWESARVTLATAWSGMQGTFREMKSAALTDLTAAVEKLKATWGADWGAIKLDVSGVDVVIGSTLRKTVVDLREVGTEMLALEGTWRASWARMAIATALHQVSLEITTVAGALRASLVEWDAFGKGLEGVLGSIDRLVTASQRIAASLRSAGSGASALGSGFATAVEAIRAEGFGKLETSVNEFRSKWAADWESARVALATSWVGMQGTFSGVRASLVGLISSAQTLKAAWGLSWSAIKADVSGLDTAVGAALRNAVTDLNGLKTTVMATAVVWKSSWSQMVTSIETAWAKIDGTLLALETQVRKLGTGSTATFGFKVDATDLRQMTTTLGQLDLATKALNTSLALAAVAFQRMATLTSPVVAGLRDLFTAIKTIGFDQLRNEVAQFSALWLTDWTLILSVFQAFWDNTHVIFLQLASQGFLYVTTSLTSFHIIWTAAWATMKAETETGKVAIVGDLHDIATGFAGLATALQTFRSTWSTDWTAITAAVSGVWTAIGAVFSAIVTQGLTPLDNGITTLKADWGTAWSTMATAVTAMWASVSPIFTQMATQIGTLQTGATALFSSMTSAIGLANAGGNTAAPAVQIPAAKPPPIGKIITAATGGTIPPSAWSWVGEKGPELLWSGTRPASVLPSDLSQSLTANSAATAGAAQAGTAAQGEVNVTLSPTIVIQGSNLSQTDLEMATTKAVTASFTELIQRIKANR